MYFICFNLQNSNELSTFSVEPISLNQGSYINYLMGKNYLLYTKNVFIAVSYYIFTLKYFTPLNINRCTYTEHTFDFDPVNHYIAFSFISQLLLYMFLINNKHLNTFVYIFLIIQI